MIRGIPNPPAFFTEGEPGFQSIAKRVRLDYRRRHRTGVTVYRAQLKSNRSSRVSHWRADLQRFQPSVLYDVLVEYDGERLISQVPIGRMKGDARMALLDRPTNVVDAVKSLR